MKDNIDIFVAMHQKMEIPVIDEAYKFIQAGAAISSRIKGVEYDDKGINI